MLLHALRSLNRSERTVNTAMVLLVKPMRTLMWPLGSCDTWVREVRGSLDFFFSGALLTRLMLFTLLHVNQSKWGDLLQLVPLLLLQLVSVWTAAWPPADSSDVIFIRVFITAIINDISCWSLHAVTACCSSFLLQPDNTTLHRLLLSL